jgi:hypothetical protein
MLLMALRGDDDDFRATSWFFRELGFEYLLGIDINLPSPFLMTRVHSFAPSSTIFSLESVRQWRWLQTRECERWCFLRLIPQRGWLIFDHRKDLTLEHKMMLSNYLQGHKFLETVYVRIQLNHVYGSFYLHIPHFSCLLESFHSMAHWSRL